MIPQLCPIPRTPSLLHRSRPDSGNLLTTLLLLLDLEEQRTIDVWQDTTECDRRSDQCVQLFVTSDGKLQMSRCDTLDFEVLCGVAREFKDFGGEVLEDGCDVDGSFGADAHLLLGVGLQETLYATAWEL